MALEFDEQLSRLEKPNRNEMTNKEYAVFNENVETMEKNWGFINNLFKVLPLNASQYIGFLDFKGSLFNPDTCYLTNADKEMIGVFDTNNGSANEQENNIFEVIDQSTREEIGTDEIPEIEHPAKPGHDLVE